MNGDTIAIVAILFGALQAIGLAVLAAIWAELKGVRKRLHEVENKMAAQISFERVKRELGR